ncbi:MAG: DUF167 domain-containing protein [Promethearchaeota archaeon]
MNIRPNSKNQRLVDNNEYLTIFLRSKPVQNKANKELIHFLKKKLDISSKQIKIIAGIRNSNKIIQIDLLIDMDKIELLKMLFD